MFCCPECGGELKAWILHVKERAINGWVCKSCSRFFEYEKLKNAILRC